MTDCWTRPSKPASQSTFGNNSFAAGLIPKKLNFSTFLNAFHLPSSMFCWLEIDSIRNSKGKHTRRGGRDWEGEAGELNVFNISRFFYCHWFMFNLCINLYQTRAWEIYILCFEMYSLDGFLLPFPPLPPPERLFSFIREISLLIIWNRFSLFTLNHVYVSAFCGFLFSAQSDGGRAGWELSNCSTRVSVAAIPNLCFPTAEVSQIKYRTNQRKYVPRFSSMTFEWGGGIDWQNGCQT